MLLEKENGKINREGFIAKLLKILKMFAIFFIFGLISFQREKTISYHLMAHVCGATSTRGSSRVCRLLSSARKLVCLR